IKRLHLIVFWTKVQIYLCNFLKLIFRLIHICPGFISYPQ
ncbi:uncharacterized protein J3R85_006929, partial [Psidium guajava]